MQNATIIHSMKNKKLLVYGQGQIFKEFAQNNPLFQELDIRFCSDIKYLSVPPPLCPKNHIKYITPYEINDFISEYDAVLITLKDYAPIIDFLRYEMNISKDIYYLKDDEIKPAIYNENLEIIKSLHKIAAYMQNIEAKHNKGNAVYNMRQKFAAQETFDYINSNPNADNAIWFDDRFDLLNFALSKVQEASLSKSGNFLEFGVFRGESINYCAKKIPQTVFYGFDSFEGLPDDWHGHVMTKGAFSLNGNMPDVLPNVKLIKGLFKDTLPKFLFENPQFAAFIHIDCDIYSSAKDIFSLLETYIVKDTIMVFDEYFNYPAWKDHEFKAFQEYVNENDIKYEYIGFSNIGAAVKIL